MDTDKGCHDTLDYARAFIIVIIVCVIAIYLLWVCIGD